MASPARQATGLVLRLTPRGESDLMVDIFTRESGRLAVLAKGAKRSRRRFAGILLSGQLLAMTLAPFRQGGDLLSLQAAALLNPFLGLRLDYRRLLAAAPIWELLLRATALHDPNPLALDLAEASLRRLERAGGRGELGGALLVFLARLLKDLGYGLELSACLVCRTPFSSVGGRRFVLSLQGGLLCAACAAARGAGQGAEAPAGLVRGLAAAASLEPAALGRLSFPPALQPAALAYLLAFWRRVCGHDLPALGLFAREAAR